jgi:hypothetical protein
LCSSTGNRAGVARDPLNLQRLTIAHLRPPLRFLELHKEALEFWRICIRIDYSG